MIKGVNVTIHNGKIESKAHGYLGQGCEGPINAIKAALGGKVDKEEATHEAFETEEDVTLDNDHQLEQ